MGLFKKISSQMPQVPTAPQQPPPGTIGVQGAGAVDPALFGGPSTQPLAVDDPLLAPIAGVSLEQYAQITKAAANRGVTDEAGVCAVAEWGSPVPAATNKASAQQTRRKARDPCTASRE